MPADSAGGSEQTDSTASTPISNERADKQETRAVAPETAGKAIPEPDDIGGIMDHLDLPAGVREQLLPKKAADTAAATVEGTSPEPPAKPGEDDDDEDEPEEEPESEEGETDELRPAAEQRPDKREKRIKRLTRQKAELAGEVEKLKEQLSKVTTPEATQPEPITRASQLVHIQNERDLDREVAAAEGESDKADAIIDLCDANADGMTTTDDKGETNFINAQQIAEWRRKAEKAKRANDRIVIAAERRRTEIKKFQVEKDQFDTLARGNWPQLFDKGTKEYQIANSILNAIPSFKGHPETNYAIGLILEGMVSLQRRSQNGAPVKQHKDIDERAFSPRVPIAPSAPNPPSRDATAPSQKKYNEAMSKLVADPDGGAASLAAVMAAMDESTPKRRGGTRSPVRT